MNEFPEHLKLDAVKDKSQAIGEFLEWLQANGVQLCRPHKHTEGCEDEDFPIRKLICGYEDDSLVPIRDSIESLLASFFGIDPKKLEEEKQYMLRAIRAHLEAK